LGGFFDEEVKDLTGFIVTRVSRPFCMAFYLVHHGSVKTCQVWFKDLGGISIDFRKHSPLFCAITCLAIVVTYDVIAITCLAIIIT
jgi:hypothetical protein